jgi:hypothetical protein
MGRGKRRQAVAARQVPAGVLVALSDTPHAPRLVPLLRSLPRYLGSFSTLSSRVVGVHVQKTWGLAVKIAEEGRELELERDVGNQHDANAVACYLPACGDRDRVLVGYLDAVDAALIAPELDAGAPLRARPTADAPVAGAGSKGGALDIEVFLSEQ